MKADLLNLQAKANKLHDMYNHLMGNRDRLAEKALKDDVLLKDLTIANKKLKEELALKDAAHKNDVNVLDQLNKKRQAVIDRL